MISRLYGYTKPEDKARIAVGALTLIAVLTGLASIVVNILWVAQFEAESHTSPLLPLAAFVFMVISGLSASKVAERFHHAILHREDSC